MSPEHNNWHPKDDYYCAMGLSHLDHSTVTKKYSIKKAAECFKKGIDIDGDNGCRFNYTLLAIKGYVECSRDDIIANLQHLADAGLLSPDNQLFIVDGWNPLEELTWKDLPKIDKSNEGAPSLLDSIPDALSITKNDVPIIMALKLRLKIERKLYNNIKKNWYMYEKYTTGKKINMASQEGLIYQDDARKLLDITTYVGGMVHDPPKQEPESMEQIEEWYDYIDKFKFCRKK